MENTVVEKTQFLWVNGLKVDTSKLILELFLKKKTSNHSASIHELTVLWNEQRGECALCGDTLVFNENTHIDHIVSKKYGGENNIENYQFVCAVCNYAKRALSTREFVIMCIKVSAKHKYTIPKMEKMGILSKFWDKDDKTKNTKYKKEYLEELSKSNGEVRV